MVDAVAVADMGGPPGTVVAAGFQEQGRGRKPGHVWDSPAGKNLLFTIYLENIYFQDRPTLIPLAAGLAVARAVTDCCCVGACIRWPNDVLVNACKVCGILCVAKGSRLFAGIGINCNQTKFPEEFSGSVTSLCCATGRRVDRDGLFKAVLEQLYRCLMLPDPIPEIMRMLWIPEGDCLYVPESSQGEFNESIRPVCGKVLGIGKMGELLFLSAGAKTPLKVISGSIRAAT